MPAGDKRPTCLPRVKVPPPPKTPLTSRLRSRRGRVTDSSGKTRGPEGGLRHGPADVGAGLRVQERKSLVELGAAEPCPLAFQLHTAPNPSSAAGPHSRTPLAHPQGEDGGRRCC